MGRKQATSTARKGSGTRGKRGESTRAREKDRDQAAVRKRPGPRPADYTAFLEHCLAERAHREAVARVLKDPDHRHFATVLRDALDRVYGRPAQLHEHTGRVTLAYVDDRDELQRRAAEAES